MVNGELVMMIIECSLTWMVTNDYSLTDGSIPQTETFPLLTIFHFSRWSPLVLCYMNSNIIFHYQYIGINSTANKSIIFFSRTSCLVIYTVTVRPYPQAMSGVGTFLCFSSPSYRFFLYNTRLITFRNSPLCFIRFLITDYRDDISTCNGFWSLITL